MADNATNTGQTDDEVELNIPAETQEKFPELVVKIQASKSMDNKERNYWLQVLPVMTEEQIDELREILDTEQRKLAAIEKKYSSSGASAQQPEKTPEEKAQEELKKKQEREHRKEQEKIARQEENVDDILSQLESL